MTSLKRRNRVADVDPPRLALLNGGRIEAANLTEGLAVDFAVLLRSALPEAGEEVARIMGAEAKTGITRRMALAGRLILGRLGPGVVDRLRVHPSDTVRGWGCFVIGALDGPSLAERLALIRPLADDRHFGVREWAWMAVRPYIAADVEGAVALLPPWALDPSERVRRFVSEATRPRGVWCAHIAVLKRQPDMALPLLEPLKADPARYVQDSVGNWLNDASKDRAEWVRALCGRWRQESPVVATARICKRGLRSLEGKS
ncbi:MAG: DNA alkylation repair protein [Desulfocurvibacter africanus]